MKKVYVVTSGDNEDYGIEAIFSTREKADEFMKTFPYEYNDIVEYCIDTNAVDKVRQGYFLYRIDIDINGEVETIMLLGREPYNLRNINSSIWKRSAVPFYKKRNIKDILVCRCWAKSEDHAIKIANEKRAQMIESGEFK